MHKSLCTGFGFFTGISYPFQAISIIWRNSSLWQYLIIPIAINLIVGITTYILLLEPSLNWFNQIANSGLLIFEDYIRNLPEWLSFLISIFSFLTVIAEGIFVVLIFVILGLIITQFGSILGAPWYGKLSEKIEIFKTNKLEIIELNIIHDISRAILFELKKLGLIIVIGLPLFIINFLPGIGSLCSFIGGLGLTLTIVCLDFFDATLERRRLQFRQKLKFVMGSIFRSLGFSLICLALISIPLLNLVMIPICVSAGTLLVCDRLNKK